MKRIIQTNGKSIWKLVKATFHSIWNLLVNAIRKFFLLIGYSLLWISYSIGKLDAKMQHYEAGWNWDVETWKDIHNDFLERRKILKKEPKHKH